MKEKYENPVMEIVVINEEDIIFASGDNCCDNGGSLAEGS